MNYIRRFGKWVDEKYRTLDSQRLVMNAILVISLSALVVLISTEALMYRKEESGILGLFFIMIFLLIMLLLVNVYPHKIGLWSAIVTIPINFVFFSISVFICIRRWYKIWYADMADLWDFTCLFDDRGNLLSNSCATYDCSKCGHGDMVIFESFDGIRGDDENILL